MVPYDDRVLTSPDARDRPRRGPFERSPGVVDVQERDLRLIQQAEGYLELELPLEARRHLAQIPREHHDTFEWNFLMAETYRALGEHQEALAYLDRARAIEATHVAVHVSMGWCLKRLGRLNRAIETLLEANAICENNPAEDGHALVMYNLSCYYALAGKKELVLLWLGRALEREPSYGRMIPNEHDFDSVRDDEDFTQLVESHKPISEPSNPAQ